MKAYSQSKRQIIDIPDQPEIGGNDSDQTRKLFAASMLANPKQSSTLKSVFDLLYPEESASQLKAKTEQNDIVKSLQDTLFNIGASEKELNESGSGIGYSDLFGIRGKLPGWLGGIGKEGNETKTQFSKLNTRLFETAGKAFTGPERALLEGLVVDLTRSQEGNKATLNDAKREIVKKLLELNQEPQYFQGYGTDNEDGFIPD